MVQKPWGRFSPTLFYLHLSHIHCQSPAGLQPAAYVSCLIRYIRKQDFVPNTGGVRHEAARGGRKEWAWNTLVLACLISRVALAEAESCFLFLQVRGWSCSRSTASGCCFKPSAIPDCCFQEHHCCPTTLPRERYVFVTDRLLRARELSNTYIYTNHTLCECKGLVQSKAAASEGTRWGHE